MIRQCAIEYAQLLALGLGGGLILGYPLAGLLLVSLFYIGVLVYRLKAVESAIDGDAAGPNPKADSANELARRLQQRRREQAGLRFGLLRQLVQSRRILDALPDPILIIDERDEALWLSKSAADTLRLPVTGGRGASALSLIRDRGFERALASVNARHGHAEAKVKLSAQSSSLFHVHLYYLWSGIKLAQLRDISEKEGIVAAQKKLIANFSHEIKTPLTLMQGYIDILDEKHDIDSERIERIRGLIARIDRFAQDNIARLRASLEMSAPALAETEIDIAEWARAYIDDCEKSGQLEHSIETDIEPGAALFGRATEIDSIFTNLLNNARFHTPPGTAIKISAFRQFDDVIFEVADEGPGIPEHEIGHLTEMFYQYGDRIDQGKSGGQTLSHGMGLPIVEDMLRRYRGQLTIQSALGKGSTFRCRIPMRTGQSGEAHAG